MKHLNERNRLSCGEAGDCIATAQRLVIAGERHRDFAMIRRAVSLWHAAGWPVWAVKSTARALVRDDKKEFPQHYNS